MTATTAPASDCPMVPDKPLKTDEPWITLPTLRLVGVIVLSCVAAAGIWAGAALGLGYSREVAATGALGAAMVLVFGVGGLLLIFPWMAKPASTAMLMWLVGDMVSMGATLIAAYLLYSATFLQSHPLLLGVALAFFIALLAKVAVVAGHMRKHYP